MRTWISFRTPIRGIRLGVGASLPAAQIYRVSAAGAKVWRLGSTLIWSGRLAGRKHGRWQIARSVFAGDRPGLVPMVPVGASGGDRIPARGHGRAALIQHGARRRSGSSFSPR